MPEFLAQVNRPTDDAPRCPPAPAHGTQDKRALHERVVFQVAHERENQLHHHCERADQQRGEQVCHHTERDAAGKGLVYTDDHQHSRSDRSAQNNREVEFHIQPVDQHHVDFLVLCPAAGKIQQVEICRQCDKKQYDHPHQRRIEYVLSLEPPGLQTVRLILRQAHQDAVALLMKRRPLSSDRKVFLVRIIVVFILTQPYFRDIITADLHQIGLIVPRRNNQIIRRLHCFLQCEIGIFTYLIPHFCIVIANKAIFLYVLVQLLLCCLVVHCSVDTVKRIKKAVVQHTGLLKTGFHRVKIIIVLVLVVKPLQRITCRQRGHRHAHQTQRKRNAL